MLLMDGTTGQVLYQQNGTETNYPASTTKLLTALVAVEHGKLNQMITISAQAIAKEQDSSSCYLNQGEQQPLEYLLYGLLIASGNDCADAIAEGITDGKPEQFVAWMNEAAKRAGAANSQFTNPHGLHDPGHYTTALDLALITRAALNDATVRTIASTRSFVWPGKNNGVYYNHNALVGTYQGLLGGKTGFTGEAGLTLVNAAERNGQRLIGVVMGYQSKETEFADMESLLDWGFATFTQEEVLKAGAPQGDLPVSGGKAASVPVAAQSSYAISRPRDGKAAISLVPRFDADVKAPIAEGQRLGVVEVREGGRLLGSVPVVATQAVLARPLLWQRIGSAARSVLIWGGSLFLGLFLFRTIVKTVRRSIRRRRRMGLSIRTARPPKGSSPYRLRPPT